MADQEDEKTRPAAYPDSDAEEQATIEILEQAFNSEVKSHLDSRDKVPNHDGYLEILDSDGSPTGRLVVQVKKLPKGKDDPPRKQVDTRHLAYFRALADPFLLLLVDIEQNIGYWKHITQEWFEDEGLDSQESKVVRVPSENRIQKGESDYISEWRNIIEETQKKIRDYEKYEKLRRRSNPAIGREKEHFASIHTFLDSYHDLLENRFHSLKEEQYPNVWKFGFGSIQYTENSLHYTLYPIYRTENDAQIREIDSSWDEIQNLGSSRRRGIPQDNPLERNPERFAYNVLRSEVKNQIRDRNLDFSKNTFLAEEYVYSFVDKYAELLGLEKQETYHVDEVREGYYRYLQFWLAEDIGPILEEHGVDSVGVHIEGYLDSDIDKMNDKRHTVAREQTKETSSDPPRIRIHGPDFDQELLERLLDVLVESPKQELSPQFRGEDLMREDVDEVDSVWDLYSDEVLLENIKNYYNNFPKEFKQLISENYGVSFAELDYPPSNHLIVVLDISGVKGEIRGGGWTVKKYWVESGNEEEMRVDIYEHTDEEVPEVGDNPFESFRYRGTEPDVVRMSRGSAYSEFGDVIRRSSLLEEVLDKARRELDSYLRDREERIQHPAIGDMT
ncbi:DUF4365 domain-containing protein [Halopiger thermotolerans]